LTAGSITTLVTNPIWTVQTAQSTKAVAAASSATAQSGDGTSGTKPPRLSATAAAQEILKQDGVKGFWRGIGPALILVINPVIQVRLLFPIFGSSCGAGKHKVSIGEGAAGSDD
jgi:adenine nucleotide transporter 17